MFSVTELVLILVAGVVSLIIYMKWNRQYWRRRNVPYIEATSIWGNVENPFTTKRGMNLHMLDIYDEFRKLRHKHGGFYLFTQPAFMPTDPELIKHILAKDFAHFLGQGITFNTEKEPLSGHLANLWGEEWRNMRVQLTPTFTSGKMKMMFNTLLESGGPMMEHIDKLCEAKKPLDIKEILGCFTTDIIGSCAFGLECNSFKDPDAEFRRHGRAAFEPSLSMALLLLSAFILPQTRDWFYVRFIKRDTEEFFINAIKRVMDHRKINDFKRNDFIQLFVEMQQKARENGEEGLTLNQIAAQAFVFFIAGFETSSTTMTFALHELAFNQDIQDKLREEIKETMKKYDGKLTYDAIMEMKYMDKIINETLRKYPPAPAISRLCNKDFQVPDTDTTIVKGIRVFISIMGLHRDEEYYPNSEKFDPERFSEENKAKRPPFTFLPFGEGPRMCIGLRFGVMQAKTGIAMLLCNYRILPAKGENYKFDFDPKSLILTKKGPVMLTAEKLRP